MTEKELREYIPFIKIASNCILSKRGDLTFGWRVWLPTAYTVNDAGYDSIQRSFFQAYKLLPPYCVVHKQDIYRYDSYKPKDVDEKLGSWFEKHHSGRQYLNGYCYIYLTFSSKSVIESQNKASTYFHDILDPKIPSRERIEDCFQKAELFESSLNNNPLLRLSQLKNDDILCCGDNGVDRGVIPEYLRMYSNTSKLDYELDFHRDEVVYGDRKLRAWYIEDSDRMPSHVLSARKVGSMSSGHSNVFLSGGSVIGYELRIPHVVNRYVLTLPVKVVERELDSKKRMNNSFSYFSSANAVNAGELASYLLENEKDSLTTVKCFTDVLAWGTDDEMGEIRKKIINAFNELEVTVCEERRHCPVLHYAGIPGAAAELGYNYYMTSEMSGFLCHGLWDGYDMGFRGGLVKFNDRNRLVPIPLDLQQLAIDAGMIGNQNGIVIGPSGTGKSFTMNDLIKNFYLANEHILIVDIGNSYQGLCRIIREETGGRDGVYNDYDPAKPYKFNPFKNWRSWDNVDADGDRVSSGYDFIMSLLKTVYVPETVGGWTKPKTSVLDSLLRLFLKYWVEGYPDFLWEDLKVAETNRRREKAARDNKPFNEEQGWYGYKNPLITIFREGRDGTDPIFEDFYQFVTAVVKPLVNDGNFRIGNIDIKESMFDVNAFGMALDKYSLNGLYGYLLNAEEEEDLFASRLTVFEVDKIKDNEDLFPIWVLCIMHSFEDKMRSLRCQKVMVIEEAWQAIAKESMQSFIVWMWRTARKYSTSAYVVTQSLEDLVSSDVIKDAIIVNSDVKILLDQSKNVNNFDRSMNILGLNEKDKSLVLSVGRNLIPGYLYKEAFVQIGPQYSNVFAIEVSLEEAIVYESKNEKKKPVFELADKLGSYIAAVEQTADEMRESMKLRIA